MGYKKIDKAYIPSDRFPIRVFYRNINTKKVIFPYHMHSEFEIWYLKSGYANIRINDSSYVGEPGDCFIFNSIDLHFGETQTENLEYYCIQFEPSLLAIGSIDFPEIYMPRFNENRYLIFQNLIRNEVINSIVVDIYTSFMENDRNIFNRYLILSKLHEIAYILTNDYVADNISISNYNQNQVKMNRIIDVLTYLDGHYKENIKIEELSKQFNISESYLMHTFKDLTGMPISQYVINKRLNKAEKLLNRPDLSITDIAYELGFSNSSYFTKLYKKHRGTIPSTKRKGNAL